MLLDAIWMLSHAIFGCAYQDNWKFIYWCLLTNTHLSGAAKGKSGLWLNNLKGTELFTSPGTWVLILCFEIINVILKHQLIVKHKLVLIISRSWRSWCSGDRPGLGSTESFLISLLNFNANQKENQTWCGSVYWWWNFWCGVEEKCRAKCSLNKKSCSIWLYCCSRMSEAAWACHLTWHTNNKVGFKSSFYMVSLWNMQREISGTILF